MPTPQIIINLSIIFLTAVVSGIIAKKLKQPSILGYLLGGLIVGNLTGIGTMSQNEISLFAQLGIALLMFLLGIEFSFKRFRRVGMIVVWGGTIQILLTILLGIFLFRLLGFDFYSALFLGAVFSLSSTAVVVKLLTEHGMIQTIAGEISVGWLILQDLAVLPIVILLPAIFSSYNQISPLASLITLGKGIAIGLVYITIILIFGKYVVKLIFNFVSKIASREILLLTAFSLCIILAGVTQAAGLTFALGAFLAGMLISQTDVLAAVFSEVRPLRDLFSTVFFVSLGFLINISFIYHSLPQILLLVLLVIILKFLIVFGLTFSFGYHSKIAFLTAVSLVQVGEFAFVLAQMGLSQQIVSQTLYSLILSVAIITMLFTPPIIKNASFLYNKLYPLGRKLSFLRAIFEKRKETKDEEIVPFTNHIILVGYGRVGSYVGRALEMEKIPFVVIDYNRFVVDELNLKGIVSIFGDPANLEVLTFAKAGSARVLVITAPDLPTQEAVIANAQTLNKKIHIYCRTHYEEDQMLLKSLGAEDVVQPEFEASLSLVHKLLNDLGISPKEIDRKTVRLKIEHGKG